MTGLGHADIGGLAHVAGRFFEVAIVGAGPGGAFAARELARRGRSVLLIDKAPFPRYKVCGCCINARAMAILAEVGLADLVGRCGAVPLRTLQLRGAGGEACIRLAGAAALSRVTLDAALVEAARAAGAVFIAPAEARLGGLQADVRPLTLRRGGHCYTVSAGLVIAADGLGGRSLRDEDGGARIIAPSSRIGAGAVADGGPSWYAAGRIYMACGAQGYVGLVRLEDGRLNLAAAFDAAFVKATGGPGAAAACVLDEVCWPPLPGIRMLGWRGTPWLTSAAPRVAAERLFVLGDAAGYVEPFSGEGIGWALAMAQALVPLAARAASSWEPRWIAAWERRYRSVVGNRMACRWSAWVLRHGALRRGCLAALALAPGLAQAGIRRLHRPRLERTVQSA